MEQCGDVVRSLLNHPETEIRNDALFSIVSWGNSGSFDRASVEEIRELLKVKAISFAPDPDSEPGYFAVEAALKAMTLLGADATEFLPDLINLIDRQICLEMMNGASIFSSGQVHQTYEIHSRFQAILSVLRGLGVAARPAVPSITRRLGELHSANRIPVALILFDIGCGAEVVIPELIPLLTQPIHGYSVKWDFESYDATAIARQAGLALCKVSPSEAKRQVSLLIAQLASADAGIDEIILSSLTGLGCMAHEAVPVIVPLVGHSDVRVRQHAVSILSSIGPDAASAVECLVAQLDRNFHTPAGDLDIQIIGTLGRIGPPARAAIPALLEVIANSEAYVERSSDPRSAAELPRDRRTIHWAELPRLSAISTLGKIGVAAPNVLKILRSHLKSPSPSCRIAATAAIGVIAKRSDVALPDLLPMLHDRDAGVRVQTAIAIGNLEGDRQSAVGPLKESLADEDSYVSAAAASALGKIGKAAKPAVPTLIAIRDYKIRTKRLVRPIPRGWTKEMLWFDPTSDFQDLTLPQVLDEAVNAIERKSE